MFGVYIKNIKDFYSNINLRKNNWKTILQKYTNIVENFCEVLLKTLDWILTSSIPQQDYHGLSFYKQNGKFQPWFPFKSSATYWHFLTFLTLFLTLLLYISLFFIKQSFFAVPRDVRINLIYFNSKKWLFNENKWNI